MEKKLLTVKVFSTTKKNLDRLKTHHRESYDDVISRLTKEELSRRENTRTTA